MNARGADRALSLAIGAGALLALGAMFWPIAQHRIFTYADLGNFFLPMRIFAAESLGRGVTPLWMPNLFCGFYAHGEGQIGMFHPLRWLLYRFLPITEAFNVECLIPYPLALAGVAMFLRRLALPASAALFGGVAFAFSAYLTLRLVHPNAVLVLAHVGWLLLAIDVMLRESGHRRRLGWLGVALVTGSQVLVGYPVAIAYCWMLALPYAGLLAAKRKQLGGGFAVAAAALATGLGLGAIQLLPTWDYLGDSLRASPRYDDLTEHSLHPMNLLSALGPWIFQARLYQDGDYSPVEQGLYLGAVVPIAAVWVFVRWKQVVRDRALVAGLLGLSGIALGLALGRHGGLYRLVAELPLVGVLRAPARMSFVLYFAGAVLAAIAFTDLVLDDPSPERRRQTRWVWTVPAASWLAAGIALALRGPSLQLARVHWIALGPLVFTLAAALFTAAVHGHRAALYGLVALALADGAVYGATLWWHEPPETLAQYRDSIARPPVARPDRLATEVDFATYRARDGRIHYYSSTPLIVHGFRLVSGYAGLAPRRRLDYSLPASQRIAGATVRARAQRFVLLSGALPRARLVAHAPLSAQPELDIAAIDVATTALVDESLAVEAGPAGTAAILEDVPGAIRIAVEAPTRQLLVVAEGFHRGWRADVDGTAVPVVRANGDFMGIPVPPGAHEVRLSFAPRSFAVGCWTSFAVLAIALAAAVAAMRAPAREIHAG